MSAATMIACAADEIVLGKHSFLGPIDPQFVLSTRLGQRMVPAQAILEQFDRAKRECAEPSKLAAWVPMLDQYGPDILVQCENASKLCEQIAGSWLATHMFRGQPDGQDLAARIAAWLANHGHFRSHRRHIPRAELEERGMKISHLEADQAAQDLFLSVFHATTHTFDGTPAVKIVENHLGRAFIKSLQVVPLAAPAPPGSPRLAPPEVSCENRLHRPAWPA